MIDKYVERIMQGGRLEFSEALTLATGTSPAILYHAADLLRKTLHQNSFDLCSIINARSGKCSENCRFCAQSSFYDTEIETYDLVETETVLAQARENEAHGVHRYSLVTAGREVGNSHLARFGDIYEQLRSQTNLALCASMGFLTAEKAQRLKTFGVSRYHCNLEASRSFFPQVCSTHSWEEKVKTLETARAAGLELCSGGIIGMGESLAQRLELAFELRDLGVLSIPLNILTPIPHTPFADFIPLKPEEVLVCVAMFRLINPQAVVRMAGGRMLLGDEQYRCFTSGANGAIVGNYLTTIGNSLEEDLRMLRGLGFSFNGHQDEEHGRQS